MKHDHAFFLKITIYFQLSLAATVPDINTTHVTYPVVSFYKNNQKATYCGFCIVRLYLSETMSTNVGRKRYSPIICVLKCMVSLANYIAFLRSRKKHMECLPCTAVSRCSFTFIYYLRVSSLALL